MKKLKILYVDDEVTNLLLFKINLKDRYNVLTAEDGMEGLEILSNNSDISVVVSDLKMPGMNGIEFIEKTKEKFQDMKCFILTGYEITSEIQESINSGLIIDCFGKPFDMNKIDLEIKKVLEL